MQKFYLLNSRIFFFILPYEIVFFQIIKATLKINIFLNWIFVPRSQLNLYLELCISPKSSRRRNHNEREI